MIRRIFCLFGLHDWKPTGQASSRLGLRFMCSGCGRVKWEDGELYEPQAGKPNETPQGPPGSGVCILARHSWLSTICPRARSR
jgi:hypothetical protein